MCSMNAATSEARKFSPSPTPTTSGLLRRAATTRSGSSPSIATSVNAPCSRPQTCCIASVSVPPSASAASTRWAAISVSVSERSSWPAASSSARSAAKFSMIPLCTSATRPVGPEVRVRVDVVGGAVGGPAGVPDAGATTAGSGCVGQRLVEVRQLAGALLRGDLAVVDQSDARGVVAAVLQPAETVDHHALGLLRSDVPDDSTHGRHSTGGAAPCPDGTRLPESSAWLPATATVRPPTGIRGATGSRVRTSSSTVTRGRRSARPPSSRLQPEEIDRVRGLGDELDLDEVQQVYLPLSRLLSMYAESAGALHRAAGGVPRPAAAAAHAVRDRPGRLGRGRQVDDRAGAAADARALARAPVRGAGHHRRLPATPTPSWSAAG